MVGFIMLATLMPFYAHMRRTTGGRRLEPAVPTEPIDFSCSSSAAFVLKQERCAVLCVEVVVVTWRLFYKASWKV